ncbi:uroporphyrinogen-III synthase [Sphingomonas crocodyli]|uniref:Uroporphyrinogen-III synthase n=1 Tax=Sphingomonas crocodyli TaxID=1979270 RepID=A0A437LZD5_9SPHN|nr:uroporphyrinogen-III synthase [Sphingomonas crocodyli]RVT90781.1 uroporphyrinogen-III synthase [Sphingomonas crocodyli]
MSRPALIILRPEPGATQTMKLAREQGWNPYVSPIFRIESVAWDAPPAADYEALIVTSANAVRQAGKGLRQYRDLPAYAVGSATARALKAEGFPDIHTGRGDAAALLATLAEEGVQRALHLAGVEHRDASHPDVVVDRRIVYQSAAAGQLGQGTRGALAAGGAIVLLHSGRAAQRFAELVDQDGIARAGIGLAALSPAILADAGTGWGVAIAAPKPDDIALLAAAARLCH